MFSKYTQNIHPVDSSLRIIVATLLLVYAVYSVNYLLLFPSLLLLYTVFTHSCFIYRAFTINERFSENNYYLSLLPKYRKSPVFIFDIEGKLVFKNSASLKDFSDVQASKCLGVTNFKDTILNSQVTSMSFKHEEKYYQVELQGIKKEQLLLAYLNDVTEVVKLNHEIEETQREIIYAMGEIGETRSKETGNHVKRVALYSKELALLYGLSPKEADKLQMASPMHDIGKVGIPDSVLNAPRKLDKDEWIIMQTHAELGYNMLKSSHQPILQAAAIVANEHHEKYDGSGYPNATVGEEIHIYGRITAIADVFDALGSERVYKKAWELEKILTLFKEESGKHFDPKLIELFLANLDKFLKIRDTFKDLK